ncbi:MAG: sensor histidine kinase [Paenibacillaceae bacterium]|nr:sensor histidine kinase [Paenibacillaceae bacterium]
MQIERRAWQWVDWVLFGILTSGLGIGLMYIATATQLGGILYRLTLILAAVFCYLFSLLFWHPGYTNRTALPLAILISSGAFELYLTWRSQEEIVSVLSIQLIVLGFHARKQQILFNIIVFIVLFPVVEALIIQGTPNLFPIVFSRIVNAAIVFGVGLGLQKMYISHYSVKQLYEENLRVYRLVQEQNKALEQYASQIEKMTLVEERNRLAKELHDTVGHTFTSVIMGMDAVSYLMETAPDKAREKLDVLRKVARDGLEEVRRNIHQIAEPVREGTFLQQMAALANEFSAHTGTQVNFKPKGEECQLPMQVQLTMVRCLQEALTNAKRHGQASMVDIGIEYGDQQVTLTITDNGVGVENIESGFGLTAMRERLAALQGSLQFTSSIGSGVTVVCAIPVLRFK